MKPKLEFFYDYVSPYSYLADTQLDRLGAEIVYRPMLLGGVMKATGNSPPKSVPAKGNYLDRDLKRWVERYGVPFHWNSVFPQNTVKALRIAIVAQHQGWFEAVHPRLFSAAWIENLDLSDDAVLASIIEAAGQDPVTVLEEIVGDEVKAELRANSDEAVARGVFGAPTFFVGEEMFFGNDRLDFVREALQDL
jgi:2-hydroxychromene-2-carboxylate isomerase